MSSLSGEEVDPLVGVRSPELVSAGAAGTSLEGRNSIFIGSSFSSMGVTRSTYVSVTVSFIGPSRLDGFRDGRRLQPKYAFFTPI